MNELLAVIGELGQELHPDRIEAIVAKIEAIGSIDEFDLIKMNFGPNTDKDMINRMLQAWRQARHVSPRDIAFSLRGASATSNFSKKSESIQLVWSGPSTDLVAIRHTEQVLCELINTAKQSLFIVSFVAYKVDSILNALRKALERQVKINILIETTSEHGGRIDHNSEKVLQKLTGLNVYTWFSGKKVEVGISGAVHAKCAVADSKHAFITSANLTGAAMELNMEVGVLVQGGDLPFRLQNHLNALITTKIIQKI